MLSSLYCFPSFCYSVIPAVILKLLVCVGNGRSAEVPSQTLDHILIEEFTSYRKGATESACHRAM